MTTWWCEYAWLGGDRVARGVLLATDGGARLASIDIGVEAPDDAIVLRGVTIPAFANAHSHAFHRALRGRTHEGRGSFWSWRDQMYRVAGRLDPDTYHALARATFAEMALAGIGVVGEFHYVHHQADGSNYDDPNAMGEAVMSAAEEAGVRITLLDTAYLEGGFADAGPAPYRPISPEQRRFSDGSDSGWISRVGAHPSSRFDHGARLGAAVHSVRAVSPAAAARIARWADDAGAPLHVHVSEQPAENEACQARLGRTPVEVLADAGVARQGSTAVHVTHLTESDIALLGRTGTGCCFCPTTERDLADGVGPSAQLVASGCPLSLGSDSHAVIDPFEDARALELDERLVTLERGVHTPAELLTMATANGYDALGWDEGGRLEVGGLADFTTVGLESPRLAGFDHERVLGSLVFSASAADVVSLVVGGRQVVADGRHLQVDVAEELRRSISAVTA